MWSLEQGIELARQIEPLVANCRHHVAMGGGVLLRGTSDKDLDIFIYPHKTTEGPAPTVNVIAELQKFGFADFRQRPHEYQGDTKTVYESWLGDKRVDFFFVQ